MQNRTIELLRRNNLNVITEHLYILKKAKKYFYHKVILKLRVEILTLGQIERKTKNIQHRYRGGLCTNTNWSWLYRLERKHYLLAMTNLSWSFQVKSQTHRRTRISHMDQSEISNQSSPIKDYENIHSSICHSSYISTCAFYKKQMPPN